MQRSESRKKQADYDITQCKADILRAAVAPTSSKKPEQVQEKPKQSDKPAIKIVAVEPEIKQQAKPQQVVELRPVQAKPKPAIKELRIPKFEEIIAQRNGNAKLEVKIQKEQPPVKAKEPEKPKDDVEIVVIDEPEEVIVIEDEKSKRGIPEFNLGEQILKEQRKVAATRRKRPAVAPIRSVSIDKPGGTIGEIISEAKKPAAPVRQVAAIAKPAGRVAPEKVSAPFNSVVSQADEITSNQQRIIAGIVNADIMRMCGSPASGSYAWQSFANN